MLVLSRKEKESILIGDNVEVRVAHIDGDTVKLAIKAPKEVSILRKEVHDSVSSSNQAAISSSAKPHPKSALKPSSE